MLINKTELKKFHQGHSIAAYNIFGAHLVNEEGKDGVRFTIWAPNAKNVQVVGPFNEWDGYSSWMIKISEGIFSLFVEGLLEWDLYKYNVEGVDGTWCQKSDPYAFYSETRPKTCSIVCDVDSYDWEDKAYLKKRTKGFDKPMNIYEAHLGAWMRHPNGDVYSYIDLADRLIPYVQEKGYTHIEIMPLNEHPFDGSWGYQATGYFSCTSRYGDPKNFMYFVDECHKANIGIIMDIVPVHFVNDAHGLKYLDGCACYEYESNDDAHSQWGTMNFDLSKEEVRSFLMSASAFWCDKFHIDGLRIDAVSNMIYWGGNKDRGVNVEALNFIKRHNFNLAKKFKKVFLIAEDSSDFANVTTPTIDDGLGFDYKWDLGFMNDTLKYYELDPIYRKDNHNLLTFSMAYYYSEKFILPFSHDEVVHGKKTILDKMWGDYEQKFSQARNLYAYMFTHPGKKLNFMGNEIGMFREFDEKKEIDWFLLDYPMHQAFERYTHDLNQIYLKHPAFSKQDFEMDGFKWLDADNNKDSIFTYVRKDKKSEYVVLINMSANSFENYEIKNVTKGNYLELINSEKDIYFGCNMCNYEVLSTCEKEEIEVLDVRVAPFAAIIFKLEK